MGSRHDVDFAKVRGKLNKMVENTLEEGVYVPMKGWHTGFVGGIPHVKVRIVH